MQERITAEYVAQLYWTYTAYYDAAGLIMRVYGEDAKYYAEMIRMRADQAKGHYEMIKKAFDEQEREAAGGTP